MQTAVTTMRLSGPVIVGALPERLSSIRTRQVDADGHVTTLKSQGADAWRDVPVPTWLARPLNALEPQQFGLLWPQIGAVGLTISAHGQAMCSYPSLPFQSALDLDRQQR
jgi:hypothetical protein